MHGEHGIRNYYRIRGLGHRIRIHRRATRVGTFEVFEAAHVALRTLLAFSQPVNCIFWPIGMLNWLVAASKLHKHSETCCTAEWPFQGCQLGVKSAKFLDFGFFRHCLATKNLIWLLSIFWLLFGFFFQKRKLM